MKMVLWTSDKRTNSRSGVLTLLLLACVAVFLTIAPLNKVQALADPKIGSWSPPTVVSADSYYDINVSFAAPVSQSTWVTVGGYGVCQNTVWVPTGSTQATVGVWTPEFGAGSASLSLGIGISVSSGPGQPSENRQTDGDNAQALWAD